MKEHDRMVGIFFDVDFGPTKKILFYAEVNFHKKHLTKHKTFFNFLY